MTEKFILKRCSKCGALIQVLKDCTCEVCGIKCCDQQMNEVVANTIDCAVEKHKPTYKVKGDKIEVVVNHVMENEHYIEFIEMVAEDMAFKKFLKVGEQAKAEFPYIKGACVYAFCNKHGLWSTDVE